MLGAAGLATAASLTACSAVEDVDGPALSEGVLSDRYGLHAPRWRLALPRSGPPRGLVISLHGFGATAETTFDLGYADAVEASRMALVSVDGGNGYWHGRNDGTDSGAMVREELVPLALDRSGLAADTAVTLLGWSMGGFGALLIASDLGPSRVSSVVAASAALWLTGSETPARAYDGRADFDQHSIFGRTRRLSDIAVRLDCGTSDPFIGANRTLAARLADAETHFVEGGHDDEFWRDQAAAEMVWAAQRA